MQGTRADLIEEFLFIAFSFLNIGRKRDSGQYISENQTFAYLIVTLQKPEVPIKAQNCRTGRRHITRSAGDPRPLKDRSRLNMDTAGNTGLSQAVSYSVYLTQKRRTFSASTRKAPFPHLSKKGGAGTRFYALRGKTGTARASNIAFAFCPLLCRNLSVYSLMPESQ